MIIIRAYYFTIEWSVVVVVDVVVYSNNTADNGLAAAFRLSFIHVH